MQIPVLVEPVPGNGFRASGGSPLTMTAEGLTREEALRRLRDLIHSRLTAGSEIVPLDVSISENPWEKYAGMFEENPLFDKWQQAIEEYRRQVDETQDVP